MSFFNNMFSSQQPTASTQQPVEQQPAAQQSSQQPANPLDEFKDLWKPAENAKPANTGDFDIDPDKFMEVANKMDFSQAVTPELMSKINAGGEDATKAFVEAMNNVAKATYGQNAIASAHLVQAAYKRAQADLSSQIESKMKSMGVSEVLTRDNPLYKHEAVAPVIEAVKAQLQTKYPQASNEELATMAKNYFQSAMGVVAPATKQEPVSTEPDWAKLLGS